MKNCPILHNSPAHLYPIGSCFPNLNILVLFNVSDGVCFIGMVNFGTVSGLLVFDDE